MRIQTFSIVAGSEACNARCPFCISKMTVPHGVELVEPEVDWRSFHKACTLAVRCGVTTAMLTGKGEPTLFPHQITRFLSEMEPFDFPMIELQTNGLSLARKPETLRPHLRDWHRLGLTTVAVSIVHWEAERNRSVYTPDAPEGIDLAALTRFLHEMDLSVRLACVLAKGFVDSPEKLLRLVEFAREIGTEQLTVRAVRRPERSRSERTEGWVDSHGLTADDERAVVEVLGSRGTRLLRLMHGAVVYDLDGQNVCATDCLTLDPAGEDIRQLIFFPDGHLRYDWQYAGAILL